MEESNRVPEKRVLTEKLIAEVDVYTDSPSKRAEAIWSIVSQYDLSDWDMVCFCAEVLGKLSQRYLWMTEAVKQVNRLIYAAHYLYPQNFNARIGQHSKPDNSKATQHTGTESQGNRP